jgi:hypothetical protein
MHYYLDIQEQITNIMKKFTSNDLKHQIFKSLLWSIAIFFHIIKLNLCILYLIKRIQINSIF